MHYNTCTIACPALPCPRYNDMIMARLFAHEDILELAQYSSRCAADGSIKRLLARQQRLCKCSSGWWPHVAGSCRF